MSEVLIYKGYIGSIKPSIEDNCLYGKIEFINDLVMFDGETVPLIKQAFEDAVDSYLATCAKRGVEPNQPFKGSLNIRLGSELHKKAAFKAKELGVSINDFIKSAVNNEVY